MTDGMFRLVIGVMAGVAGIAEALLIYFKPKNYEKVCASLPIVTGAITEVCTLFVV